MGARIAGACCVEESLHGCGVTGSQAAGAALRLPTLTRGPPRQSHKQRPSPELRGRPERGVFFVCRSRVGRTPGHLGRCVHGGIDACIDGCIRRGVVRGIAPRIRPAVHHMTEAIGGLKTVLIPTIDEAIPVVVFPVVALTCEGTLRCLLLCRGGIAVYDAAGEPDEKRHNDPEAHESIITRAGGSMRAVPALFLVLALTGCERVRSALHVLTAPESAEAPPPPPAPEGAVLEATVAVPDEASATVARPPPAAAATVRVTTGSSTAGGADVTVTSNGSTTSVTTSDGGNNVTVSGERGVVVDERQAVQGVVVGGENGVLIGKDENTTGVRVGGENGVVVGKDGDTKGVRVGGENGVEVGKGGIIIGGKTIVGKGKK